MRLFAFIGLLALLFCSACQEPEEGCQNPRAVNFDPSADVDPEGICQYYQLQLQWQHYSAMVPDDTLQQFERLTDAVGEEFYLEQCNWLGSNVYLTPVGSNNPPPSPATVLLYNYNGTTIIAEDNFFSIDLERYSDDAVGWDVLDTFDRLSFQLGIDPDFQNVNPNLTNINQHPLSLTAMPYLHDSTLQYFKTLEIVAVQPNNNNARITVNLSDVFPFTFPYNIRIKDGETTRIRVRLNYDILFARVSFSNDPVAIIADKLRQNIPLAVSVY